LVVDRSNLRLQVGSRDAFPDDLPAVLKDTVDRLDRLIADATEESEKIQGYTGLGTPVQAAAKPTRNWRIRIMSSVACTS